MEKIKNYQKLTRLSCKFEMHCNATLDDTCSNLFRKDVSEIILIRQGNPDNVTDKHIKRMKEINKICKAIVKQINLNYNK